MDIEERLFTPVKYECDVCVCGGGFAGIAAALSAARHEKKVILIEKEYMLGGLGTAGMINVYLPLCDGLGHQVSFGIAEELLRLSEAEFCKESVSPDWINGNLEKCTSSSMRFISVFNPSFFAIAAEQLLVNNGVQILYGTSVCSVSKNGEKIDACIIENKSGRSAVKLKSIVDATGDADITSYAGVPCVNFEQGNILAAWYGVADQNGFHIEKLGASDIPDEEKNKFTRKVTTLYPSRFYGLDGDEISKFTRLAHNAILNHARKLREEGQNIDLATLPVIPQYRMTRHIQGEVTLSIKDDHAYFSDSIGMVSDWRQRGPVFEVPFSSLYSQACPNLICAGRCTSVTEAMWDVMRVIPCCVVTGQAAGLAAALSDDFTTLNVNLLQNSLRNDGVTLHWNDLTI